MHFQEFNMKNQMQHEQSSCVLNNKKKEIPCRNKLPAFGQYFTITDKDQVHISELELECSEYFTTNKQNLSS